MGVKHSAAAFGWDGISPLSQPNALVTCAADGEWDTRKLQGFQPDILPRQVH